MAQEEKSKIDQLVEKVLFELEEFKSKIDDGLYQLLNHLFQPQFQSNTYHGREKLRIILHPNESEESKYGWAALTLEYSFPSRDCAVVLECYNSLEEKIESARLNRDGQGESEFRKLINNFRSGYSAVKWGKCVEI